MLLHILQGFDPNRPGVIVVFHGHGANLSDDARPPAGAGEFRLRRERRDGRAAVCGERRSSAGKFWEKTASNASRMSRPLPANRVASRAARIRQMLLSSSPAAAASA